MVLCKYKELGFTGRVLFCMITYSCKGAGCPSVAGRSGCPRRFSSGRIRRGPKAPQRAVLCVLRVGGSLVTRGLLAPQDLSAPRDRLLLNRPIVRGFGGPPIMIVGESFGVTPKSLPHTFASAPDLDKPPFVRTLLAAALRIPTGHSQFKSFSPSNL